MLERAISILQSGGVVAFPTETVYGLGADARQEKALRQIFTLKQRPLTHPLIVHLAQRDQVTEWGKNLSSAFYQLARHFWPGPLTLIVKKQAAVLDIVTAGQDTIGIRIPRHPIAEALLKGFGSGIAAPSANVFTHISPTTSSAVYAEFGEHLDLILEGGDCEVGLESTIVDVSSNSICILRPGMITQPEIEQVLNEPILLGYRVLAEDQPRVPGTHVLHYAPRTPTAVLSFANILQQTSCLGSERIGVLLRGAKAVDKPAFTQVVHLPDAAKPYARGFYRQLRFLDTCNLDAIWIEAVPLSDEWEGIHDRLTKACHQ